MNKSAGCATVCTTGSSTPNVSFAATATADSCSGPRRSTDTNETMAEGGFLIEEKKVNAAEVNDDVLDSVAGGLVAHEFEDLNRPVRVGSVYKCGFPGCGYTITVQEATAKKNIWKYTLCGYEMKQQ